VAREVNQERRIALAIVAIALIVAVRGIVAASTPLSYDEAYYWLWSRNLASGYYDHPPAIAFIIRAGTAMFGDTSLAVWRSGAILAGDAYAGALAALLFNLMPMVGIEALVATPDSPSLAAAAFFLFSLAKVSETGRGAWWIAAGMAAGFAVLSKYTGFFLGLGALTWLSISRNERRWLVSAWPYAGAGLGLLMFVPVLAWNSDHEWISLRQQLGRIGAGAFTLRYLGEFLAGQFALASPVIAVLAVAGMVQALRSHRRGILLAASIAPAVLYFLGHSLRGRVQGNWPSFLYPALAIAASMASIRFSTRKHWRIVKILHGLAMPIAAFMLAVVYGQAVFGFIPILRDPVSRLLAVGIERVVMDLETLREQNGAQGIVTTGYAATAWFSFYLPSRAPVVQLNERYRYLNAPTPPKEFFDKPLLYVTELRNDMAETLKTRFAEVTPLAHIARYRSGAELDEYMVYRVSGARGDPFF
jgi:4-amino-4-deoxy-L-arabinose transferase-like glycosyltransferase